MTEPITLEQLKNASLDAKTLEQVINGDDNTDVTSRLGATYPTLDKALRLLAQNGLLGATAYNTYAELVQANISDQSYAVVTNDTTDKSKNGYYQRVGSELVFLAWNPLADAIAEIDKLNLKSDQVIHDERGNIYDFAGINTITNQIVSGIGAHATLMGDVVLERDDDCGLMVQDKSGKTALYIDKNGQLRYPVMQSQASTHYAPPPLTMLPRLDIIHIAGNGQSLGDGSTSDAGDPTFGGEISTSQPYNNIMLAGGVTSVPRLDSYNGTAFVPLIAGATKDKGSGNEQPIVNATNGLTRRILATNKDYTASHWVFCASYGGRGGTRVEALDSEFLPDVLQQITDIANLAKSQNKSCAMWFYEWHGNEAQYNAIKNGLGSMNERWTADPYTYEERLMAHYNKIVRHAVECYTHQTFMPYLCIGHQINHAPYKIRKNTIAIAQWRMSRKYPFVMLAAPVYQFRVNTRDYQHLHHTQAWLLGEYIARAYHHTMTRGKWRPCEPVAVTWTDTHIDVEFYTPHGDIVIDNYLTYQNINYPNAGFDIWTDDDTLDTSAISSVAVLNNKTIRITLNKPITAVNAKLTYGRGRDGDIVSGGNVRDSHGDIDSVTIPTTNINHKMHNACVMFEYSKIGGF